MPERHKAKTLNHTFDFDPSYGYSLDDLLAIQAPAPIKGFSKFWRKRYNRTIKVHPQPRLIHTGRAFAGYEVYDLVYTSTDNFEIQGWILIPMNQPVQQCIIVGHGYGGRDQPDYHLKIPGAALMFPCFRGLGKSQHQSISADPVYHVLHDIHLPDHYILGGCVDDLWLAVSALLHLFPTIDEIGYMGISLGGGIGALAVPWDKRIKRVHLNIPSFGHHTLRMKLPTLGSADSVQRFIANGGHINETLACYDAAISAGYGKQSLMMAAAKFDPYVAPPGQFAIFNAWQGQKDLFVLEAGHFDYPGKTAQDKALLDRILLFFMK